MCAYVWGNGVCGYECLFVENDVSVCIYVCVENDVCVCCVCSVYVTCVCVLCMQCS